MRCRLESVGLDGSGRGGPEGRLRVVDGPRSGAHSLWLLVGNGGAR